MGNNTFRVACSTILFLQALMVCSQSTDIFRIEHLRILENGNGIGTSRTKLVLNVPVKVGPENYLFVGGEYNGFNIDFSQDLPFDASELDRLHVVDMNLGYIANWNENWKIISVLTPRFASSFEQGVLTEDFFFNATATLLKQKNDVPKPFRIVLGLSYNSTTGLPIPLPLVSYYRRFHPKWSFTLGIPKSNFKFHPSEKHTLQFVLSLDGYFINVQDDIVLSDGQLGSRISLSALVGSLGYQFNVTKKMAFYALAGSSIRQRGSLRNKRRQDVFLLNNEANVYIRTGFKFSIF